MINILKSIALLVRPHQWVKNGFVALPFILSLKFLNFNFFDYVDVALAVVLFCLMSSSVYILNDIKDRDEDRLHYRKKLRPIASGKISILVAVILHIILVTFSLSVTYVSFGVDPTLILIVYYCQNILYTFWLKHLALFDVFSIALGFVLRVLFGSLAFKVLVSKWILSLTFTICLFLALAKRRKEFSTQDYKRLSLKGYNIIMLDKLLVISSSVTIVAYLMYIVEMINKTGNGFFLITGLFVFFGIFRYLQVMHLDTKDTSEPSFVLVKDMVFLFNLVAWFTALIICLFYSQI